MGRLAIRDGAGSTSHASWGFRGEEEGKLDDETYESEGRDDKPCTLGVSISFGCSDEFRSPSAGAAAKSDTESIIEAVNDEADKDKIAASIDKVNGNDNPPKGDG